MRGLIPRVPLQLTELRNSAQQRTPFDEWFAHGVVQRGLSKKMPCIQYGTNTLGWHNKGDDELEKYGSWTGSAAGEAHLALQRSAKQLKERGVFYDKYTNSPAIAEAAFRLTIHEMLLGAQMFRLSNWNDKAENIRAIATQLNVGLDSLVFVDDNPVERAQLQGASRMVAVPEFPKDIAHYVRCLADRDISRRLPSPPRIDSVRSDPCDAERYAFSKALQKAWMIYYAGPTNVRCIQTV